MKTLTKSLVGTLAAGAMAMTGAAPAFARDRDHRGGIDAGEIIAGAVILGGIAAIASAANKNRGYNRGYDRNYDGGYNDDYRNGDYRRGDNRYGNDRNHNGYRGDYGKRNSRAAVKKCIRAAEKNAVRNGFRWANVTNIRDVDDTRYGWKVKGRINVKARGHRGDSGKFTCKVSRGRVVNLDYRGVRGLR